MRVLVIGAGIIGSIYGWTPDEAKVKLSGEFHDHVEEAHFPSGA